MPGDLGRFDNFLDEEWEDSDSFDEFKRKHNLDDTLLHPNAGAEGQDIHDKFLSRFLNRGRILKSRMRRLKKKTTNPTFRDINKRMVLEELIRLQEQTGRQINLEQFNQIVTESGYVGHITGRKFITIRFSNPDGSVTEDRFEKTERQMSLARPRKR